MLPGMQASVVSQMYANHATRGLSKELARYVRWEYAGDGAAVRAAIAEARRVKSARKREGAGRWVVRLLAKIPESLAAALASPGGA